MVQCKAFLWKVLWLLGPLNDIKLKSMVISLLKNHVSMYNVHILCIFSEKNCGQEIPSDFLKQTRHLQGTH